MHPRISKHYFFIVLWFTFSGYCAAVLGFSFNAAIRFPLALYQPFTWAVTLVAFVLSLFFAKKILKVQTIFKSILFGFLGGLIALLSFDILFFIFIVLLNKGDVSFSVFFLVVGMSILAGAWTAPLVGAISSFLYYQCWMKPA